MNARQIVVSGGGVLEGEFFFALKKEPNVSIKYVNIDPLLTRPASMLKLGFMLTRPQSIDLDIEVIAGPAIGGIAVAYASALSIYNRTGKEVRVVWADKQEDGSFALERMGFKEAVLGKRVLVVEDVTSTGSSTLAVCDLIREAGGHLIGASVIWNRGNVTADDINAPRLASLVEEPIPSWKAQEHPMWGTWPLVSDIGHYDHFPDYPGPRIKLLQPK